VWEAHKIAWTVVSIFVPILFGLQGFFIKDWVRDRPSVHQIVLAVVIAQVLALIWWLIMQLLTQFNRVRIRKLREIERALSAAGVSGLGFQQYTLPGYTLTRRVLGVTLGVSATGLYRAILVVYTLINMGAVVVWHLSKYA
jgi:hypothetical protein